MSEHELVQLDDLIAHLREVAPLARNQLAAWRILVAHPWILSQLFHLAGRATGARSAMSADDLVQEAIVDLSRRNLAGLDLSRPRRSVAAYLRRLLHWAVLGAARRARGQSGGRPLDSVAEPTAHSDALAELWEMIHRLPDKHFVELRAQGLSFQEIAGRVGVPFSVAYKRHRRACDCLLSQLAS